MAGSRSTGGGGRARSVTNGNEGDGNPPGLGPGQTRFDPEIPDSAEEGTPGPVYEEGSSPGTPASASHTGL
jgi:hypothetical protein